MDDELEGREVSHGYARDRVNVATANQTVPPCRLGSLILRLSILHPL
jgi:hypothetical protein